MKLKAKHKMRAAKKMMEAAEKAPKIKAAPKAASKAMMAAAEGKMATGKKWVAKGLSQREKAKKNTTWHLVKKKHKLKLAKFFISRRRHTRATAKQNMAAAKK